MVVQHPVLLSSFVWPGLALNIVLLILYSSRSQSGIAPIYIYIHPLSIHINIHREAGSHRRWFLPLRLPGGLVVEGADLKGVLMLVLRIQPRGGHLPRRAVPPQGAPRDGHDHGAAHLQEEAVVDVADDPVG